MTDEEVYTNIYKYTHISILIQYTNIYQHTNIYMCAMTDEEVCIY